MLYLEDYLEMIEHLPQELRDRFTEMREMDLQVQNSMDSLEERTTQLFANARKLKPELRTVEYDKIRQDYYKSLEDADEKVHMANQVYDLVDRYLRRLDQELQKFKMELEADNAGITEILERRSLELDNPPPTINHNHQPKAEKRKYTTSSASYGITNGSEKRMNTSDKLLHSVAADLVQDTVKYRAPGSHHQQAALSPFSSNHGSPLPPAAIQAAVIPSIASVAASSSSSSSSSSVAAAATAASASPSCSAMAQSAISYSLGHMGSGSNAIAAAASQAIAATQQMSLGRRTASLKASFQAVNSGLQGINKDFGMVREVAGATPATAGAAAAAVAATVVAAGSSMSTSASNSASSSPAPEPKTSGRQKKQTSKQLAQMLLPPEPPVVESEECQEGVILDEYGNPIDVGYDPNEPRYCTCNQVSYGDMVACDNEDCPVEWFHYNCVGIEQPPRGKWYCPQCTTAMRRRGRK